MVDKQTTQNQIDGLIARGKDLRVKERIFLKASGLDEQAEKCRQEAQVHEIDIDAIKEELSEFRSKKEIALMSTLVAICGKISELLPVDMGEGRIEIDDDGNVIIGLQSPKGSFVTYGGLSGGQKVIFKQALACALLRDAENKVLIYEAAEIDPNHLSLLLQRLLKIDAQVIVNTWFKPEQTPDDWNVVYLNV